MKMASSFFKSQIPAWMKVAVLVLGVMVQCIQATPRNAPFSLQAAVDELHRREAAKYPLNAPPPPSLDDWDEGESEPGLNGKMAFLGVKMGNGEALTFPFHTRKPG